MTTTIIECASLEDKMAMTSSMIDELHDGIVRVLTTLRGE